ncbi:MAG: FKBP-type peptidyl-prolyl cis-trans isomerase [Planctomycetota bacterium]|jgi:FKBP-type peptidyl-prolyl cis-trans isomerase FklB|nr:MAG: FKBP-type peptidyl-prolyl cis-trans isomerase [Planctomycetota bacterium]GDY09507.1 peptidyl-prolyl cis-trans isomerase Mip [Planctomycetia bacterium]
MWRWLVMLSLMAVVGFAVAQDDDKPKTKAQPKAKKGDDSLELEADPNALGKKPANKKELLDKISYAMGMQIGKMKQNGFDLDPKRVIKGMEDAMQGKEAEFADQEINKAFEAYEPLRKSSMAKSGEDFLAANKGKEGIKTLTSGVQYKVLASGKGASPKATDTVKVHYQGRLIDGKFFDGSYTGDAPAKRDKPAEFPLNGVIKGFKESLTHMKVGDKWTVYLPSDLAYGERGSPPTIGPHAVLIFDLELVEILE